MIIEKKDNFHLDEDVVPGALKPLMEEFQDFILLRNTYHAAIREVSTKLEILDDEFQVRYDYNPIHHMECRLKSPRSLFEKLERKGLEIEIASIYQITDMAGIRVICNYIDDVYAVASLLLKQDDIKLIAVFIWWWKFRSFCRIKQRWCRWRFSCGPLLWTLGPVWSMN